MVYTCPCTCIVYILLFLKELFEMFVVLDYNTLVSSRALEIIWNKDSLDTEELLMGKCLCFVSCCNN